MNNIIETLDPATYGLNRSAIALGGVSLVVMVLVGSKLLQILQDLGLPSAS